MRLKKNLIKLLKSFNFVNYTAHKYKQKNSKQYSVTQNMVLYFYTLTT